MVVHGRSHGGTLCVSVAHFFGVRERAGYDPTRTNTSFTVA